MVYKFISSKAVIEQLYADLDFVEEGKWVTMIEWIGQAIEFIDCLNMMQDIQTDLEIRDYRAALPCNFYALVDMAYGGCPVQLVSGSFDADPSDKSLKGGVVGYSVNVGYLEFPLIKKGKVRIAYVGIPTDDDGFPMIPDHASVIEACKKYIVYKMNFTKYITGQIPKYVYDEMKSDWHWYCKQARAKILMPNRQGQEAVKNIFLSMIPNINRASTFFTDFNSRDILY